MMQMEMEQKKISSKSLLTNSFHSSNLTHLLNYESHIEDFWAHIVCRVIMTISWARNHHYVISHREITQMPQVPCMLELTGVITWLLWELQ